MPTSRLWGYTEKMSQYEGEQSLARVTEMAAAFGSMDEGEHSRYMNSLKRAAMGGQKMPSSPGALAGIGIQIETLDEKGEVVPDN